MRERIQEHGDEAESVLLWARVSIAARCQQSSQESELYVAAFSSWQGCLENLTAIDASIYLREVVSMCKSRILNLGPLAAF